MLVLVLTVSLTAGFLPVKAEPKMITVPDDYATIEDAVTNAIQGDTIFVRKGTYHNPLKIEKSISLVGEGRDTTIIVGIFARRRQSSLGNTPKQRKCNRLHLT